MRKLEGGTTSSVPPRVGLLMMAQATQAILCPSKQLPRLSAEQRRKQGAILAASGKAQHHVQQAADVRPKVMAHEG